MSIHTHIETHLSASTLSSFIKKAKMLNRNYMAYTDYGLMTGAYKFYKEAKNNQINPIIGIEVMFFDENLDLCKKAGGKYYPITIYAKNADAYQKLSKLSAHKKSFYTTKSEDELPLTSWAELLEYKDNDIEIVLGGPLSLPYRLYNLGMGKEAVDFINSLKEHFSLNLSLFAGNEDSVWRESVVINSETRDLYIKTSKRIDTDKAKNISAMELMSERHSEIHAVYKGSVRYEFKNPIIIKGRKIESSFKKLSKNYSKDSNQFYLKLSKHLNAKLLVSDYAFMAEKEHKDVQTVRQEGRIVKSDYYMLSNEELTQNLSDHGIPVSDIIKSIKDTEEWTQQFNINLKFPYRLPLVEDPGKKMIELFQSVGRFSKFRSNPVYMDRLKLELSVIRENGTIDLLPYFFPIAEYLSKCLEDGNLVGPARGSAGGSLISYFMGITQIDPIKYDLPFERFFSLDRVLTGKIPDIDVDASHKNTLFGEDGNSGWLYSTLGDRAAQVSTRTMMRLKSSIKDVNRLFNDGTVEKEIEKLSEKLPNPPQGVSDADFLFGYKDSDGNEIEGAFYKDKDLQEYALARPQEWEIVKSCLGISRQNSRHASAVIIADRPVQEIVPIMKVGESLRVTQFEAKECESAGLIKYDFLVVKQLLDINGCLKLINKKHGISLPTGMFMHDNKQVYIWDLPERDEKTENLLATDSYEGLFQIGTSSMFPFVRAIQPKNIDDLAIILALVRPGPLDFVDEKTGRNMAEEYIERRRGLSKTDIPELLKVIPNTYGTCIFQEDITKICIEIGGMSGEKAEILRDNMCKKRMSKLMAMKPEFMDGAEKAVGKDTAETIWSMMVTFGNYAFNRSHSYGYATITWATAFLKAHYPLEWWTSVLTNAEEKEITEKFWKHVKHIVAPPDVAISTEEMVIDYKNNLIRSKMSMIKGLSDATAKKIADSRPFNSLEDLIKADVIKPAMAKKLILVGAMDSFFEKTDSLENKLFKYESSIENFKYQKAIEEGKKTKRKQPKVDVDFLKLSPLEEVALKKSILPSMPLNITDLVCDISKNFKKTNGSYQMSYNGRNIWVLNGSLCEKIEKSNVTQSITFASPCYIVSAKEFTYSNGTKKALKLIVDTDGYLRELVKWPNYDTGELEYPKSLKKESVAVLILYKRPEKDTRIDNIIVDI